MESKIAYKSDIGISRPTNQDAFCYKEAKSSIGTISMLVIADGVGGLTNSEIASSFTVKCLSGWFDKRMKEFLNSDQYINEIKNDLLAIINAVHSRIYRYGNRHHTRMGTTLSVMMVFDQGDYFILHVGDSKVFKIDNTICQLVEDQNWMNRELKKGILSKEEIMNHPKRKALYQAIGAVSQVIPAVYYGKIERNTHILLCSDGFIGRISQHELLQLLNSSISEEKQLQENIDLIINYDKERGESDNLTGLLVRFE